MKIFIHLYYFLVIVHAYSIFIWSKIKLFDPSDITILEFDDFKLDISHGFEVMESEVQDKNDKEKEPESISKMFEQHEEKIKPNLEKTEIIAEVKEIKISMYLNKKLSILVPDF